MIEIKQIEDCHESEIDDWFSNISGYEIVHMLVDFFNDIKHNDECVKIMISKFPYILGCIKNPSEEIKEACQGEYLKFADNLTKDEIIMAYRDTYLSDIENKTYLNILINEMTLEDGVSCLNYGCLDPDDMEAFSQCCWSEDAVRLFKLEQM